MTVLFTGAHCPKEVMLMGMRWYVVYPLSYRHVEALMEERGVTVDHATVNRWVLTESPQLEEALHRRKRPVWISWRMDETSIKVKGEWHVDSSYHPSTQNAPRCFLYACHRRHMLRPGRALCQAPGQPGRTLQIPPDPFRMALRKS